MHLSTQYREKCNILYSYYTVDLRFLEKIEREPSNFLRTSNIVVFQRICFINIHLINCTLFEITLSVSEGVHALHLHQNDHLNSLKYKDSFFYSFYSYSFLNI